MHQVNQMRFGFYRLVKSALTCHNGTPVSASTLSLCINLSATYSVMRRGLFINFFVFLMFI